ncbi:hypothetical protein Daus18300_003988 [Diaporthe australafricana]|uniref:Uncharacterized protein n=1 Tax=Diaporthe australafricana TaxID=127596 RepID=A0ABR3XC15_9PEZI
MSYDNRAPPGHALQYSQLGDFDYYQTWLNQLNQFPIPQYAVLPTNSSTGFSVGPQSYTPYYSSATNTTSAYPTYPRPSQYMMTPPPGSVHQAQFMHAGPSTMVDDRTENIQPAAPELHGAAQSEGCQHRAVPRYPQDRCATPRAQHQYRHSSLYRNRSVPTNLATFHPDLGPCILVPIAAASPEALQRIRVSGWRVGGNILTVEPRNREYYLSNVDRLRRRQGHNHGDDNESFRSTTPSPSRSPSPYDSTPCPSPTVSELLHRRREAHGSRRSLSPPRFRGAGDYVRRRSRSESRAPGREASVSTVGTCSECCRRTNPGAGSSSSEPAVRGEVRAAAGYIWGQAPEGRDEEDDSRPRVQHVEDRDLHESVEV